MTLLSEGKIAKKAPSHHDKHHNQAAAADDSQDSAAASSDAATSAASTLVVVPGTVPVGVPGIPAGATEILTVGVGKEFATLSAAVAASTNGAVILVDAGTYTNDFATITNKVTIIGVGGMADFVATEPPPDLKGILTVDNDATIENLSFSGSAIPTADGENGAGIRYEGGQMVLINDAFVDNQEGILAFPVISSLTVNTITIDHSVFNGNGAGDGYTHNLYVGPVSSLTVTNSVFENAVVGHEFKSRALVNTIENNLFQDGPTGTASYDIDLPNGGTDLIANNTIEKGPNSENDAMIHFGGEGIPYAGSSLTITGNTIINDLGSQAVLVLNQTAISVAINDNTLTGAAENQIAEGPATGTGNVDGTGNSLPNISLVGVLPGGTLVITDNAPHTVVLDGEPYLAVEGGSGLLTVIAEAGHIVAIGGSGGMGFTEDPGSGGNNITTAAGSVNTITVLAQDTIDSEGTDRIIGGGGNLTVKVGGDATVDDGTGSDQWSVSGDAFITGHGGDLTIEAGSQSYVVVSGPLGFLSLQTDGGSAMFDIVQGGAEEAMSINGGAVQASVYNGATSVTTSSGGQGAVLSLIAGTVQVTSKGADTIYAGSGTATIIVSGQATVYAGTGALSLFGRGDSLGATFYGNGGNYLISGDTGNITYYGGALASTVQLQLSNNTLIGGAGYMTIDGGSRETITGGSGGINYDATDGSGGNTITTQAGAHDLLTLAAPDTLTSWGNDTIVGGSGNQVMTIYGNSTITGSTGTSTIAFYGKDALIGQGQDFCTVYAGATVTIQAGTLASVNETGANVTYFVKSPGAPASLAATLTVSGGSASIWGGSSTPVTTIATGAGTSTAVTLGLGNMTVAANGADLIHAGTGSSTIAINAANTQVWGGSGSLVVTNNDWTTGNSQTLHGGSGALTYNQGAGALSFIGGAGTATINVGNGSIQATGGSGSVTITGGSAGLSFAAGAGQANLTLASGGDTVTFGHGNTSVQDVSYGAAELFNFIAGQGGGTDVITGFRSGIDQLVLKGVSVASETVTAGSSYIALSDSTHLQLLGISDPSHIF